MSGQFPGVVQNPTDDDQGRLGAADKKVARSADELRTRFYVVPAQSQVPSSNTCAEFGPCESAGSVGLASHDPGRGNDLALGAQSGGFAKLLMFPAQDAEDIALSAWWRWLFAATLKLPRSPGRCGAGRD